MVPRRKSIKVNCRVHLGPVPDELPIIFEPNKGEFLEGIG